MKRFRCDVFRFGTIANPRDDVGIDAVNIVLIEFGKAPGVVLRRLDKKTVVRCFALSFQQGLRRFALHKHNRLVRRKVTRESYNTGARGAHRTRFCAMQAQRRESSC